MSLAPKEPAAYDLRGLVEDALERHAKAVADFTRALELDPNDVKSSAMVGQAYASQKQIELRPLVIFHYTRAAT